MKTRNLVGHKIYLQNPRLGKTQDLLVLNDFFLITYREPPVTFDRRRADGFTCLIRIGDFG